PGGTAMAGSTGITIRKAGIYRITAWAAWAAANAADAVMAITRTRSGTVTELAADGHPGGAYAAHTVTIEAALNVGDLIRAFIWQGDNGTRTLSNAWFGGDTWPRLSVTEIRPVPQAHALV